LEEALLKEVQPNEQAGGTQPWVNLTMQEQAIPHAIEGGHWGPPSCGGASLMEDRVVQEGEG
jgi:hypothetical protein